MKGSANGGKEKWANQVKEGETIKENWDEGEQRGKVDDDEGEGRTMAGKQLSVWKRRSRRRRKEIKIDSRKRGLRP